MAPDQFSRLCACGCGTTVISTDCRLSRRRRFVKGHNSKLLSAELAKRPKKAPRPSAGQCECGCGELLTTEPRFIRGHNARLGNNTAGGRGKVLFPNDPRGPNPSGLCQCGCGKPALITFDNHKGRVTGCYARFLKGHDKITVKRIGGTGVCFCGCGQTTPISKQSKLGNIKGQPQMYCFSHRQRGTYTVNDETGCWELPPRLDGYNRLHRNGKLWAGHRWYWEQRHGPIPDGLDLDHLCRNRACCNPDHLEPVTRAENTKRIQNRPDIPHWGDWREEDIKIDPTTGCWLFPIVQASGYAVFWLNEYQLIGAHRFYYERQMGKIPAGLQLDHLCRRRNCVNPLHLEPVTRVENMRRSAEARYASAASLLPKPKTPMQPAPPHE